MYDIIKIQIKTLQKITKLQIIFIIIIETTENS